MGYEVERDALVALYIEDIRDEVLAEVWANDDQESYRASLLASEDRAEALAAGEAF